MMELLVSTGILIGFIIASVILFQKRRLLAVAGIAFFALTGFGIELYEVMAAESLSIDLLLTLMNVHLIASVVLAVTLIALARAAIPSSNQARDAT